MKVLSLFSGMDMLGLGFKQAGFELVASNEVHPVICKTLRANFKHDVIDKSVHLLSVDDLRKDYRQINGVLCSFPCPVYSTAADIHHARVGVRKYDYRRYARLGGDLFLHGFRVIATLDPQPDFFVIENVRGMEDAKIVLETFENTPCKDGYLGKYYVLYQGVLNATEFGLPQNRPRYFFVGAKRKARLSIERPRGRRKLIVGDILERDPDITMPEYARRRLLGLTCRDRPIITEAGPQAIAPTVVAHYAKDRGTRLVKVGDVIRPYTVRECARLQGIPDSMEIEGSKFMQYVQVGNAVPVPVAYSIARGIRALLN